ncbi:MAG: CHRD domain-containing protein [Thaumarchaeota archaeon]|nr:MAG: CHRD domain-containing protein [Nitrososphaerota archaeon]TLX84679.1 MAG: CHRD domain-containing protein [Nitrososphaerota archaeon]
MHNLRYLAPIIVTIWTLFLISNTVFAQNSFRADLVGEAETPPLFSESYGTALISGNDNSLMYKINVTSLDKVTGVYLYRGDNSENGQVLVALLNSTKPTGVIKGTLAQGTINESSILVPLANLTIAPANNMTSNMTSVGNMTSNMTSVGNMTSNMTSTLPAPVPANNMTSNMTSVGNMTSNMTSTLPAPVPASKLASLIELMNQNMTYINIHTSKFPDGELRGTLSNSTN